MPPCSVIENQHVPFDVRATGIEGLWIIQMRQVSDERGTVREFYRESAFREAGLPTVGPWVQINITETRRGAIRGLHGESMYKLVAVASGEAFGAYVDMRPDSKTLGDTVTCDLVEGTQVLVPPGVCNGFQSTSPGKTQYLYCFNDEWRPGMAGVAVNALDPTLNIPWPIQVDSADPAQLSKKDANLPGVDGETPS